MALSPPSPGAADDAPISPQPEKPNSVATDHGSSWAQAGEILLLVGPRLLLGALVLLAIIFFSFLGLELATGAPLLETLATATAATVRYVQGLLHGDLGLAQPPPQSTTRSPSHHFSGRSSPEAWRSWGLRC
jgi:hypothetical protein